MDYKPYYIKKPNGYLVHFPNFAKFTEQEIRKQFELYGNVLIVDTQGKESGLCFVTYKTEEDVVRCLEGLRKNKEIRILKHKSHSGSHTDGKVSKQMKKVDAERRVEDNDSEAKTNMLNAKTEHTGVIQYSKMKGCTKASPNSSQDDSKFIGKSKKKVFNKKVVDSKMPKGIPALMTVDVEPITKADVENKPCSVFSYTDCKANPMLDNHVPINDSEQLWSRVSSPTTSIKSSKTNDTLHKTDGNTPLAQEVIVANIEDSFGIHYILHLFEKYNPIAASMIKTSPRANIRYCHIYFSHWKEALATQQEFDDYSLEGKKLIVLLSQNLIREALAV